MKSVSRWARNNSAIVHNLHLTPKYFVSVCLLPMPFLFIVILVHCKFVLGQVRTETPYRDRIKCRFCSEPFPCSRMFNLCIIGCPSSDGNQ